MGLLSDDVIGERIKEVKELSKKDLDFLFDEDEEIQRPAYEVVLENGVSIFSSKNPNMQGNGMLFARRKGSLCTMQSLRDDIHENAEDFETNGVPVNSD